MSAYRNGILHTYKYLITVRNELITHSLNIAMTGEMNNINKAFEVGDIYNFDVEQFKGTNDMNLNKLIDFYEELENLMNSFSNINAITEEDLEE